MRRADEPVPGPPPRPPRARPPTTTAPAGRIDSQRLGRPPRHPGDRSRPPPAAERGRRRAPLDHHPSRCPPRTEARRRARPGAAAPASSRWTAPDPLPQTPPPQLAHRREEEEERLAAAVLESSAGFAAGLLRRRRGAEEGEWRRRLGLQSPPESPAGAKQAQILLVLYHARTVSFFPSPISCAPAGACDHGQLPAHSPPPARLTAYIFTHPHPLLH